MTEWSVVGVIVVLAGLVATLVRPMLSLNRALTENTVWLKSMNADLKDLTEENRKSHERLWKHNDEQDRQLDDHEKRIFVMEHRG